jgi:hypothetical protein
MLRWEEALVDQGVQAAQIAGELGRWQTGPEGEEVAVQHLANDPTTPARCSVEVAAVLVQGQPVVQHCFVVVDHLDERRVALPARHFDCLGQFQGRYDDLDSKND